MVETNLHLSGDRRDRRQDRWRIPANHWLKIGSFGAAGATALVTAVQTPTMRLSSRLREGKKESSACGWFSVNKLDDLQTKIIDQLAKALLPKGL
ncbi:MAG: hypothetical protein M3Q16_09225 [Pseudomonadota bacterium]|nr:hypothetical protein [Pseudomonadota bacterium]